MAKVQFLSKLHLTIFQNPVSFEVVKLLSPIFLVTLSFSLLSCPSANENGEEKRRFRGGRTKKENPTKRSKRTVIKENSIESLGFPIIINTTVHSDLSITSSDNEKMSIAVEPSEKPMKVVAGMSGQLSLSTENGVHTLILSSSTISEVIYLELTEENTELKVSNGVSVNLTQVLAHTTNPLIFYVKKNEELTVICFPIETLAQKINVKKNFADHKDCQKR